MSLNWNVAEIKNYKKYCWEPKDEDGYSSLKGLTNTLIWACMTVGLGEITEKNWKQFYLRINFLENTDGTFLSRYNEKRKKHTRYFITTDDIHNHIGLSTNADDVTSSKWWKRISERAERGVSCKATKIKRNVLK